MKIISGVYKITNTITGDFYIGSSKNIKIRWANHKIPSTWNEHPNNPMYLDMQKFGLNNFEFQVIAEVEAEQLKEKEQQFIEKLQPTYNNLNAKGRDIERIKESRRKANNKYRETHKDEIKEYNKKYNKTDKRIKYNKEYNNQLCNYNGEILTLTALATRFRRAGIPHPVQEAKKYLIKN